MSETSPNKSEAIGLQAQIADIYDFFARLFPEARLLLGETTGPDERTRVELMRCRVEEVHALLPHAEARIVCDRQVVGDAAALARAQRNTERALTTLCEHFPNNEIHVEKALGPDSEAAERIERAFENRTLARGERRVDARHAIAQR